MLVTKTNLLSFKTTLTEFRLCQCEVIFVRCDTQNLPKGPFCENVKA